jgi:protein-S-isoprenylcysteine O-methyltransferase Ste14
MKRKNMLPPTYLVLSIIAIVAVHFVFPLVKIVSFPWNLVGIIPLVMGLIINLVADKAFKRLGTTVKPYEESTSLITDGVFRFSRHPMYLGMVLILIGISILLGSVTPFLVTATFTVMMETVFIKVEERMMREVFGDAYLEYKKKVRKWL